MNSEPAGAVWRLRLREFSGDLWALYRDRVTQSPSSRYGFNQEARTLTESEWEELRGILTVQKGRLVFELTNACFGFGCGLRVFTRPVGDKGSLELLLTLTQRHLPGGRAQFRDAWNAFTLFTHTEENIAAAKALGVSAPMEFEYYDGGQTQLV